MLDKATRYITRKVKKLDYIHTKYPQDYEAIKDEYKRLRNNIKLLSATIKSLETYEYGGTIMKNFTDATDKISNVFNVNITKESNIYLQSAKIGDHLANTAHNSSTKQIGMTYSRANEKIAEHKKKMNKELQNIQGSLDVLKDQSGAIDINRRKAEDLRYDLEELKQEDGDKDHVNKLQIDFDSKSEEALRGMKTFMSDVGLAGILKRVAIAHREFLEAAAKELGSIK